MRSRSHFFFRDRLRLRLLLLAVGLALASNGLAAFGAPSVRDGDEAVSRLAELLSAGQQQTDEHLVRLGFAEQVNSARGLDGGRALGISPRTMIETLYQRAESNEPGGGNRFLAVLYYDASERSAAIATDVTFDALRKIPKAISAKNIQFAPPSQGTSNAIVTLDPTVNDGISKLGEIYAGPHFAQSKAVVMRNLRSGKLNAIEFERVLASSKTAHEAIQKLIRIGTPPPSPREAVHRILRESALDSAAISSDPEFRRIVEELSKELPANIERYAEVDEQLPSRKRQVELATALGQPGKHPSGNELITASAEFNTPATRESEGAASSENVSKSLPKTDLPATRPSIPGNEAPSSSPATLQAEGNGPAGAAPQRERNLRPIHQQKQQNLNGYRKYTNTVFRGPSAVAPKFRTARFSARAGRGVAVGGEVKTEALDSPHRAFWIESSRDGRFGRLFVDFGPGQRKGVSRVLFADSFLAAHSILWDEHEGFAKFENGNILIVMSMDPDAEIESQDGNDFWSRVIELGKDVQQSTPLSDREKKADALIGEVRDSYSNRGIVFHPAIAGRELAWSTARIDFCFSQLDQVSAECAQINGGASIPPELLGVDMEDAMTWQFYELDSVVELGGEQGAARQLLVRSPWGSSERNETRSHFAISMFGIKESPGAETEDAPADIDPNTNSEDDFYERLPEVETRVQPLLDWLSTNHHDFMRVNDLSEALSLLRWLKAADTELTIIDSSSNNQPIATPDFVKIGDGPVIRATIDGSPNATDSQE